MDPQPTLLIEFAIFGFAMNSIYGFGQMLLSGFLGTGRPRFWAIESAFWLHNMGVVTLALAGMKILPEQAILFGAVSIAAGTFSFAFGQHAFISKRRTTRSPEKGHWLLDAYIPLAFFWLVTSVFLLVGVHVYEALSGNLAPHAIIGAIRHALTVGFMTTLILGVGQRLIPVFEHSAPTTPELVAPILLLIAIGNALRFVAEIATLYIPVAFVIMPLSALMEWTALLLFTVVISVQIRHRDSLSRSGRVSTSSSLAVLLAYAPWIEEVLIRDGLHYLARARSIPQELTIGAFARSEHRDAGALVDHLNDLLASHVVDDAVNNELRHQVS